MPRKVTIEKLVGLFRLSARYYNEAAAMGCESLAIDAPSRAVHSIGRALNYPGLSNDSVSVVRKYSGAVFSAAAWDAHLRGAGKGELRTEHVSPQRELTRKAIALVTDGGSDAELIDLVRRFYLMVVLTMDEVSRLDRVNKSKIEPGRLEKALGCIFVRAGEPAPANLVCGFA